MCGALVSSLLALAPRRRSVVRRARSGGGPHDHLAVGTTLRAARRTIEGYEAMHMIRKGQARWVSDDDVRRQNHFIDQLFDLAA